jgi:methenyltetrahydromethanopterin cyclohydrolase
MWPTSAEIHFIQLPVFSSQSAGSVDLTEILLAGHRAALHDFMALSYGPARALAYDRRRGFRAWVDCDDRYGRNFCLVRCNAHKRVQALQTKPLHGVNTADAPLQER